MTRLTLVSRVTAWLLAAVLLDACQMDPSAGSEEESAMDGGLGPDAGDLPDGNAGTGGAFNGGLDADAATSPDPILDAGGVHEPALDAGGVVDAGTVPDPVIDAGVEPDPVVDAGVEPDPVVDAGVEPDPVVDAGVEPDPVVDAGVEPDPVVDSGGPDPVVDSGGVTDAAVDTGVDPDPVVDAGVPDAPADTGVAPDPQGLTIYYIRHAEVLGNTLDPADITLESMEEWSALGAQQVDALTEFLLQMGVTPDVVLVSPTWRTQKTIEPYLVATGLTGEIWMELTECPDAEPTGAALPTEPVYYEWYEATIEASNMVFRDPNEIRYWDNQTYEQGLFMVMRARDELLRLYSQTGLTIFITGHAVAGNILLGVLRGIDMTGGIDYTNGEMLWMQNTGIQKLVQDPTTGVFTVEESNLNDPVVE